MKFLNRHFGWIVGLMLAIIAAVIFGKVMGFLGISNQGVISVIGSMIGTVCSFLYRNTLSYIKSEEYRIKLQEIKAKHENNLKKEQESLKRKTISELYLLYEKKTFLKVKFLSVLMIFLGASVGYFWGFSPVVTIVGFVVFVLLELKERVLTYRISKGFYGNNSTEAIQLLKFIENNIDKIDDGGSGRRRKIFNTPASEEIPGEELGKGVLDARS